MPERHELYQLLLGTHGCVRFHAVLGTAAAKIAQISDLPLLMIRQPDSFGLNGEGSDKNRQDTEYVRREHGQEDGRGRDRPVSNRESTSACHQQHPKNMQSIRVP
ncbi:MAG: hypothetical protein J6K46_03870 [Sutterella sp.]|nr:hypothetical protein [Sutterella sp.]